MLDINISMFLLDWFFRSQILFHLRVKYNFRINFFQILNFNLSKMNLSSIYTFRDENDYLFFFIGNSKGVTNMVVVEEQTNKEEDEAECNLMFLRSIVVEAGIRWGRWCCGSGRVVVVRHRWNRAEVDSFWIRPLIWCGNRLRPSSYICMKFDWAAHVSELHKKGGIISVRKPTNNFFLNYVLKYFPFY